MAAKWSDDIGKGLDIEAKRIAMESLQKFEEMAIAFAAKILNTSPIGVQESEGEYKANWQISPVQNDTILIGKSKNGLSYSQSNLRGFFTRYEGGRT